MVSVSTDPDRQISSLTLHYLSEQRKRLITYSYILLEFFPGQQINATVAFAILLNKRNYEEFKWQRALIVPTV